MFVPGAMYKEENKNSVSQTWRISQSDVTVPTSAFDLSTIKVPICTEFYSKFRTTNDTTNMYEISMCFLTQYVPKYNAECCNH